MKVMVVDSDSKFAALVRQHCEAHGHHCLHVPDGDPAVSKAMEWDPDLVMVAAELAVSGVVKSLLDLQPRPALLIVGWMDRYDVAWRAWQIGGDELLMKPVFNVGEIHLAITTALDNALMKRVPAEPPLSLYFDQRYFTPKEIADIIHRLSDVYESLAGDRLVIHDTTVLGTVEALAPVG